MSLCTFSTAASADRPLRIASCIRFTQPRSYANMRYASSTSRCSPVSAMSSRDSMSSTNRRSDEIASSSRPDSCSTSSPISAVTTTRGSCSTTWPSPTPSPSPMPESDIGRLRSIEVPGPRQRGELADGDHLGKHHRGGLQRLDFLLVVGAPAPGSARPGRRACGRRAGSARRGTSCRFLRRFPGGTGTPDGAARRSS